MTVANWAREGLVTQERTHRRELPPSMVERLTLILDEFESRATRLTLEDVARRTHLPRSTAHRILDQLVQLCWLEHTAFGYRLGSRALGLGGRDNGHGEIRGAAAPLLHELQIKTGMVVHLAILDGAQVHYLDKVGGGRTGARGCRRAVAWRDQPTDQPHHRGAG
jgi:DNA-binding IclR family transcriptional regulator